MKAFTDAAADAVARAIAGVQREARREQELREAEHRARLAELDAKLAQVSDLERQLCVRISTLRDGEDADPIATARMIDAAVERAVASMPVPQDGKSVDMDEIRAAIAAEVQSLPKARDGIDVDQAAVEAMIVAEVERAVAAIDKPRDGHSPTAEELAGPIAEAVSLAVSALPVARDGQDVDQAEVEARIAEEVRTAVAALPPAQPGKDADPEAVARLVAETVRAAVDALPAPEKGDPGAPGKLPIVREWADRVHYESEVVTFGGSVYQAQRDTGREPPHEDWACIARGGRDGEDGRSFKVRGTWSAQETYRSLDVVALNGASFAARVDDPGTCPGEGWQLIASQGKQGKPGERGLPLKGERGDSGPPVVRLDVDADGLLTLTNADGSTVNCDLYPLLSRI